jgi:hypothetical protein
MPLPRGRRPGSDDERQWQLTRAPRGHPQQTQGQAIRPLGIVEKQHKRLLVGQLDDHPPQRMHHLVAARARPGRIRQRSLECQQSKPRRPIRRDAACRAAEQHTGARERHVRLDLVRGRVQDPRSGRRCTGSRELQQPRLADAGLALDQHRAAAPAGRRLHEVAEHRQLGLSLDQHVHGPSLFRAPAIDNRAQVQGPVQGPRPSRTAPSPSTLASLAG